ncbi:MAG TPA: CHASE2 domain-containing protein [Thermoanaerobaculia bacterium]|nr:CHASE2 domain-containing protein [Thermoanaerobaculia bacterium]
MTAKLSTLVAFYRRRPWGYWLWALLALILGTVTGEWLNEDLAWIGLKYRAYGALESLRPQSVPKWTALVLIGDEEYWKGELARRVPVKRDYLAKLLTALTPCQPMAVGIDFDLRSPTIDGSLPDNADYAAETAALKTAIERASARFPIVLPVSFRVDKSGFEASVLDGVGGGERVTRGFIAMPFDYRQVPTIDRLADGTTVPSFALALVRQARLEIGGSYVRRDPVDFPFGSFLPEAAFAPHTLSAGELLRMGPPAICVRVDHRVVIVAAAWHRSAYQRGALIDTHDSPIGTVGKYLMHANYIESMLENHILRPLRHATSRAIEIFFALVALHLLAGSWPFLRKFAAVLGMTVLLAVATYLGAQNLGVFGDFLFPAFFLVLHAMLDELGELIETSRKYHEQVAGHIAGKEKP